MASIASLVLAIGADTSNLVKQVETINGKIGALEGIAGKVGGALAGMFTIGAFTAAADAVIDLGGKLTDLSARTGIGAEALQELKFAAGQTGTDLDTVTGAIEKMSIKLAGSDKSAVGALGALGLSLEDLRRMAPEDQFTAIAGKLQGVEDPAARVKLAVDLMGKSAGAVLPMITEGVGGLRDQAQSLGQVMGGETVAALDAAGDALDQVKGAGVVLLAAVLEPFLPLLQYLTSHLGDVGAALGVVRAGFTTFLGTAAGVMAAFVGKLADLGEAARSMGGPVAEALGVSAERVRALRESAAALAYVSKDLTTATAGVGSAHTTATRAIVPMVLAVERERVAVTEAERAAKRKTEADRVWAERTAYLTGQVDDLANGIVRTVTEDGRWVTTMRAQTLPTVANLSAAVALLADEDLPSLDLAAVTAGASMARIGVEAQTAADALAESDFSEHAAKVAGWASGVAKILDNVGGKVAETAAVVARTIEAVAGSLAKGDWIGAAVAAATGFIQAFGDALHKSRGEEVMSRIGREWGIGIGEALGDTIAATARARFAGNLQAAEIFHIGDLIDLSGGLDDKNIDRFLGHLRDVFVMLETGAFTSADAIKVLGDNFGAFAAAATGGGRLASDAFLEVLELSKRFGLEVPQITAYLTGQLTGSIDGLLAFVKTGTATTAAGAAGLAGAVAAAFQGMTAAGVPAADVLGKMGPILDGLQKQFTAAGVSGGEAFAGIRALAAVAGGEVSGPAVSAVAALNQVLIGLHNSGALTVETFAGLASQVRSSFDTIVGSGATADQALQLMAPTLQTLWELSQKNAGAVDDTTLALLQQAESAGVVGRAHQSAEERIAGGIDALVLKMDDLIRVMSGDFVAGAEDAGAGAAAAFWTLQGEASAAIAAIPRDLTVEIRAAYSGFGDMPAPAGIEIGGGGDVPGFATGTPGLGFVNFGAGRRVELHGREAVVPEGQAAAFADKFGGSGSVVAAVEALGRDLARRDQRMILAMRDQAVRR